MAVSLKHSFQSAKTDGSDTSIVRPSDWNAEHVLTQATGKLLGRTTAGTGATEEISAGSGLSLTSGTLSLSLTSSDVTSALGYTPLNIAGDTMGGTLTIGAAELLIVDDADTTKKAVFSLGNLTTATTRTYSLPNNNVTLAHISNASQTFAGNTTFSNTVTFSGSTVTVGTATGTGTYGIGTGATSSGSTKTMSIGTGGVSGSTTSITIGSTTGTTVTANGTWNFSTLKVNSVPILGGPAFSAYLSANSGAITANTYTKVAINTEEFDTNSNYDNATNYRFTPTVAGYYQVSAAVRMGGATNTTTAYCTIYKNGAIFKDGSVSRDSAGVSNMASAVSTLVYLNGTTDYVELYGYVNGSGTLNFIGGSNYTYFQACLVRAA